MLALTDGPACRFCGAGGVPICHVGSANNREDKKRRGQAPLSDPSPCPWGLEPGTLRLRFAPRRLNLNRPGQQPGALPVELSRIRNRDWKPAAPPQKGRPAVFLALPACQGSEPVGNRTQNPRLKRPLLCQLSYGPNAPEYSIPGMEWAKSRAETGNWRLKDGNCDPASSF